MLKPPTQSTSGTPCQSPHSAVQERIGQIEDGLAHERSAREGCLQAAGLPAEEERGDGEGGKATKMAVAMLSSLCCIGRKKSRIRETPTLSTDADSRTDKYLKRLLDLSKYIYIFFLIVCVN